MTAKILFRRPLLHKVQQALADANLIIEAPPGYGKTILLRQLAAFRPDSYYVPLTVRDSDTAVLQSRLPPRLSGHTWLLDDIHHLVASETAVAWLVQQLAQPDCRYVLAGRSIPNGLATGMVKGSVVYWSKADLLFAPEESEALLVSHADSNDSWHNWHKQAEGWPLGLGLVARLSGVHQVSPQQARQRLFDYLAQELFAQLPAELSRFMRVTAVPLRFNDALASHLLNAPAAPLRREVQGRNLFLDDGEQPGWFRYHDLIRDYLLETADFPLSPLYQQAVAWFAVQGEGETAVEQALDANLPELAAEQMTAVAPELLQKQGRIWTFHRWLGQLPAGVRRACADLLPPYIRKLHEAGLRAEAWRELRDWQQTATEFAEEELLAEARFVEGFLCFNEARHDESLAALQHLFLIPSSDDVQRRAYELLGHNLAGLNRLPEAAQAYRRGAAIAEQQGNQAAAAYTRHNLVALVLLPMGRFGEAEQLLRQSDDHFRQHEPYLLGGHLLTWSELYQEMGHWSDLAAILAEQEAMMANHDEWIDDDRLYLLWAQALGHTGQGELAAAQTALTEAQALPVDDDLAQLCLAWAQSWLYRRQGKLDEAIAHAKATLEERKSWPFWRAVLALEQEIALKDRDEPFHSDIHALIEARAAAHLVRLRALLTVRCWQRGNGRWRRHLRAVLFGLRRIGYGRLLISRDPELGASFWAIALAEGVNPAQATGALVEIGQIEPLLPLLRRASPDARRQIAATLARIGDERAMPELMNAIAQERETAVKQSLQQALRILEEQPPPPLRIKLMGIGCVWRGGMKLTSDAFHRPMVLRLLQYFALHRGQPLPRDHILEALWPDKPPDKAWATFRSVYSRLRQTLEPFMRSNGPCRYVTLKGESYRFDPLNLVTVDSEEALTAVNATLSAAATVAIPPLPDTLLTTLENWQPLIPDLPYADWLLDSREQLQEAYVSGCHYVARALLERGQAETAVPWAQKTIAAAPWQEEAYRTLMRAYARQGQPARALKVYQEAVAALREELDMSPSARTNWLARRLRQCEPI